MSSRGVVLAVAILVGCWTDAGMAASRFAFYRVADDGGNTQGGSFERATVVSPWGREDLMIARAPSLEVEASHITSASLERRQIDRPGDPQAQRSYFALL